MAVRITIDYFRREAMRFREIMCDNRNPIDKIDEAFKGLTFVYLQGTVSGNDERKMDKSDVESANIMYSATYEEWVRRKALMWAAGHPLTAA